MATKLPNILITNLNEAHQYAPEFDSVLTAGPAAIEVAAFQHPDHLVVEFDDIIETRLDNGWCGPTKADVARILEWAFPRYKQSLLVHCHAGMSRSTASAIGVLIEWGFDEETAFAHVEASRPQAAILGRREFIPNPLILAHIDDLTGSKLLATRPEYAAELVRWGNPLDFDEAAVYDAAALA